MMKSSIPRDSHSLITGDILMISGLVPKMKAILINPISILASMTQFVYSINIFQNTVFNTLFTKWVRKARSRFFQGCLCRGGSSPSSPKTQPTHHHLPNIEKGSQKQHDDQGFNRDAVPEVVDP